MPPQRRQRPAKSSPNFIVYGALTVFIAIVVTILYCLNSPFDSVPNVLSIQQVQRIGSLVSRRALSKCELSRAEAALAETLVHGEASGEAETLVVHGLTSLALQNISAGRDSLVKAGQRAPQMQAKINYWIGEAYSGQADYEIALQYFLKAVAGDRNIYYRLAVAQTRIELADPRGLEGIHRLLKESPTLVEALVSAGVAHSMTKEFDQAESFLLRALELAPSHRLALSTLIRAYKHSGRVAQAEEMIKKAVSEGVWRRPDQYPSQYIPGFAAVPWPTATDLAPYPYLTEAMALLEASWEGVLADLANIHARFTPNPEGAHDPALGSWDAFTLNCTGSSREITPRTCDVLELISNRTQVSATNAQFLRLQPGGHIRTHCGPTNNRWVVHLGLECPPGVKLIVGGEARGWQAGKCLVFDDSIEHEVVHNGSLDRVVLGIMFPRFLPPPPCTGQVPWA